MPLLFSDLVEFVDVAHGAPPGVDGLAVRALLQNEFVKIPAVLAADVVGGVGKLRLLEAPLGLGRTGAAVEVGEGDFVFFHGVTSC